jgi:preprotein translocase subunit Sec63
VLKLLVISVIIYVLFMMLQRSIAVQKPRQHSSQNDPYEILGVSRNADNEQIKEAYREQSKKNHPDLVTHMSSDFQKLAEEKLKTINSAYSKIRAERGF